MPRVAAKSARSEYVTCVETAFLTGRDSEYPVKAGEFYRSSDQVVREFGHLFHDWPCSTEDREHARREARAPWIATLEDEGRM